MEKICSSNLTFFLFPNSRLGTPIGKETLFRYQHTIYVKQSFDNLTFPNRSLGMR